MSSRPLQRAFSPCVVVPNHQNREEDYHFNESKRRERKVVAHEDYRPRKQKDCFHVEDQKQHRDDVIAHGKTFVGFGGWIDAALVRTHLRLFIFDRP